MQNLPVHIDLHSTLPTGKVCWVAVLLARLPLRQCWSPAHLNYLLGDGLPLLSCVGCSESRIPSRKEIVLISVWKSYLRIGIK